MADTSERTSILNCKKAGTGIWNSNNGKNYCIEIVHTFGEEKTKKKGYWYLNIKIQYIFKILIRFHKIWFLQIPIYLMSFKFNFFNFHDIQLLQLNTIQNCVRLVHLGFLYTEFLQSKHIPWEARNMNFLINIWGTLIKCWIPIGFISYFA